jgi:Flp pilus assembly protein TadD
MVDAMNWLGGVLSRQGRDSEAHEWMERAYGLDPLNGSVATNMANRYWEEGDLDRAESIWHRLVDLPEPSVVAFTGLSEFYVATGRLVEDNRLTKRLLLSGSWNPFYLARNYAMLGTFQSAAHLMAVATQEHPDLFWVTTGWVQAQAPSWEGDYGQAATELRQARAANDISLEQSPPVVGLFYGINQALAGDFDGAIDTLGEALSRTGDRGIVGGDYEVDAYQAFAWSYSRKDMPEESRQLLEAVEQWFARKSGSVKTASSTDLYEAARNAAMMGDNRLALERLARAVEAGWRGYYVNDHDPRWGALIDHPRYQALMAEVKADVDRQRTEVERIDAEKDSPALPDKVRPESR